MYLYVNNAAVESPALYQYMNNTASEIMQLHEDLQLSAGDQVYIAFIASSSGVGGGSGQYNLISLNPAIYPGRRCSFSAHLVY